MSLDASNLIAIIIFVVCFIIDVVFFLSTEKHKIIAVIVGIIIVSVAVVVVVCIAQNNIESGISAKDHIINNRYVYANLGELDYYDITSDSDDSFRGHIYEDKGVEDPYEDYIDIRVFKMDFDIDELKQSAKSYHDYFKGYCAGYFGQFDNEEYQLAADNTKEGYSRGVYIDSEYFGYCNTFLYEGRTANGERILGQIKILYLSDDQCIITIMHLKNVSYDFYLTSNDTDTAAFRDCFNSIQQMIVKL